jgi:sulfate adenylyltransferase subunit 1
MDILRIATAGSVDDGKSTLIGRLLYETSSVTKDKLEAIDAASKRRGAKDLDLSLLTDGLIAEREQGITIDVAHVYFSTPKRKFIIADTPGHTEYTRNMVTGASRASLSIILIDARNGVVEQTARHYYVASLLRIPKVIVCVNKMDLVDYDQKRFNEIRRDFLQLVEQAGGDICGVHFLPTASLFGDNITQPAPRMAWYSGPALLEILETIKTNEGIRHAPRMQVQTVLRPRNNDASLRDFRGYAGKINSGEFCVGDEVVALPNTQSTRIIALERFGESRDRAGAGESVTLHLSDDIDASRGTLIATAASAPAPRRDLLAKICWLDHQPFVAKKTFVLQHGVHRVRAKTQTLRNVIDVNTRTKINSPTQLKLNEIGEAEFKLSAPIYADDYNDNPANGAFILIDEYSNNTVGVGFIEPTPVSVPPPDVALGFGV